MRQTRNLLYGFPYRGFESHPLRQPTVLPCLMQYTKPALFLVMRGFFVLCRIFSSIAILGVLGVELRHSYPLELKPTPKRRFHEAD